MPEQNKFLLEWAITFLRNRDIVKKQIVSIEGKKDELGFIVHCKDRKKFFVLVTYLEKSVFGKIKNNEDFCILTLNNKANVEFVISNWNELSNFNSLAIYFLNPFSDTGKVWVINPHVHNSICEKSSLRAGIISMSEMVDGTDESAIEINLKSRSQESAQ